MKKVFVFLVLTFFLLACTKQQATTSADSHVKEFRISITHAGGYDPNTFNVNKGDTVRFLATSDPLFHQHGITILEYNLSVQVTAGPNDPPQIIEFVANKPGEFLIWCGTCLTGPLGDHPWLRGQLIVK